MVRDREGPSQVAGSCEVAAGLMPLVHIQGEEVAQRCGDQEARLQVSSRVMSKAVNYKQYFFSNRNSKKCVRFENLII